MKTDYTFVNPSSIRIKSRIIDKENICQIENEKWTWDDGGKITILNWDELNINLKLKEILKGYLLYRFETRSPQTILSVDLPFFRYLSKTKYGISYPWNLTSLIELQYELVKLGPSFHGLKNFYNWGLKRQIKGFEKKAFESLNEVKAPKRKSYQKVFLNPQFISKEQEYRIISHIQNTENSSDFEEFRDNVLLHLIFELAPRPIQIFSINEEDLIFVQMNNESEPYYSINLPMAKKRSSLTFQKKPRNISKKLGEKIQQLIVLNNTIDKNKSGALFISNQNTLNIRLSKTDISKIIIEELRSLDFNKGDGATLLRHHLAQSLADQGAPVDVIAEILGHNSTLPARAYIAATPEISTIKTKALGKSKTYENIMKMLLTGKIIDKNSVSKDRWVIGMVGNQYIGGIGSCGLPGNTSCPFNPVYSCYTCHKFHPFSDGRHEEVKLNLQKQAQSFIDTAEASMDIKYNRPVIQLEKTIEAVDAIIERCKGGKNE